MSTSQLVESYRFWDVVTLWARELLEHEDVVASTLSRGIIRDGLNFQNADPKWLKAGNGEIEFRGYPYVGYCAKPNSPMVVLRAKVLEHLLSIVERAEAPSHDLLHDLFVSRDDFHIWLQSSNQKSPDFWYGNQTRQVEV